MSLPVLGKYDKISFYVLTEYTKFQSMLTASTPSLIPYMYLLNVFSLVRVLYKYAKFLFKIFKEFVKFYSAATAPYFYGSIRALKSEIIVILTYVHKK